MNWRLTHWSRSPSKLPAGRALVRLGRSLFNVVATFALGAALLVGIGLLIVFASRALELLR